MSVADRLLAGETVEVSELRTALVRIVFGDRLGVTVALASLVWVGLTWRLGFFSNDQYTFANTVLAVADGHLHITDPVYGPTSGATPGTYVADGRVYGRNYGIVLLSTVWYVGLRVLSLVADVRVLLTGLWSLALVAVASEIGSHFDRQRAGFVGGAAVAAVLFGLSALVAEPLAPIWLPVLALQLTTALSTAGLAVVAYRLGSRLYGRRVGVVGAVVTVAATPVGFWATLPKRHAVTALLVVCAMYTLYRSRESKAVRFRALTYVPPALLAWIHAPHGFVLLVAVAAVDLPTARSNRPRELVTVAAVFGLALVPFLLTNAAISGNPLAPPRLLADYTGGLLAPAGETSGAGTTGSAPLSGQGGGGGAGPTAGGSTDETLLPTSVARVRNQFVGSYAVLLDPGRLARVVVHTGFIPYLPSGQDAAINLSLLQSMPLLGALVAYPVLAVRRLGGRHGRQLAPRTWSPARVVDAFTLVYTVLVVGLYLRSLPGSHMLTVRYLHTLYPLGVYWLVRLPAVRRVVESELGPLAASYAGTVVVGTPAYLAAITVGGFVLDESVQLYAFAVLLVAAGAAAWGVATRWRGHSRAGAIALGIAAGATTVYLLVAGVSLFPTTGEFLLPAVRAVSEQLHYAKLVGSSPPWGP